MKQFFSLIILLLTIASCKKDHDSIQTVPFKNILILGNSITFAPADASIGWKGNFGMAASSQEKDYVHLLTAKFKQSNANSIVQAKNIAAFEVDNSTYDFDKELKTYRDQKPDLLIVRIGENVPNGFDSVAFARRYQALLAYIKVDNPDLKILAAGSFWSGKDAVNIILSRYTPFLSLSYLGNELSNYAFDMQGVSDGVKQHPGDKGMQGIADTIWKRVVKLNQ